jgi:hypothetical protein
MRGGEKDRRVRVRAEGEASRLTLFNGLNPSLKTSIEDNLLFDNMFLFLTGGAGADEAESGRCCTTISAHSISR